MSKIFKTIYLTFITSGSMAQPSTLPLTKVLEKNILQNISYIPSKSFVSHLFSGSDSVTSYTPRISTNQSFYISRVEVTNKEYRDFVQHIKDSTAHSLLQHFKEGSFLIDWSQPINWEDPLLESIMLSPDERILGRYEINSDKIIYEFEYSGQTETITIYPDTLVWLRDFSFSNNEQQAKYYFSNNMYDNHPVVGISLKQAIAFCQWKSDQINKLLNQTGNEYRVLIRLPTNTEWEAAANDDNIKEKIFAPGKSYHSNFGNIKDNNGFIIKGFQDDGYFYTSPVNSYSAGAYGLYNMKGNVAEWTSTSRDEVLNGEVKSEKQKTYYVVKGGAWNSIPFYLQTGVCQFFSLEATHSFIGFRYVVYVVK
jgi:formylglycine-generating enzyme required for sulfatase activity